MAIACHYCKHKSDKLIKLKRIVNNQLKNWITIDHQWAKCKSKWSQ